MQNDLSLIIKTGFQFWTGTKSIKPFELRQALLAPVLIALVRTIIDRLFWSVDLRVGVLAFFLWAFYIMSVCIFSAFFLFKLNAGIDLKQALTISTSMFWLIAIVPFFSVLPLEKKLGLSIYTTIPFFQWIPTFLIEKNYLPLGMVVVSPFLMWKFFETIMETKKLSIAQAITSTLLIFIMIYVIYYQWIWAVSLMALFGKGLSGYSAIMAQFIAYSFPCQVITFLLIPTVVRAFGGEVMKKYEVISVCLLILLFFIPEVGFMAVFLF